MDVISVPYMITIMPRVRKDWFPHRILKDAASSYFGYMPHPMVIELINCMLS